MNVHNLNPNDNNSVQQSVSLDYMWKLYVAHVGFSLALELTSRLPWSVAGYSAEGLRYLFESSTIPFLKQAGLIGASRYDTIANVLQWMRQNLAHFIGSAAFGNMFAIWQYRGYPPLSKIVGGTLDT